MICTDHACLFTRAVKRNCQYRYKHSLNLCSVSQRRVSLFADISIGMTKLDLNNMRNVARF